MTEMGMRKAQGDVQMKEGPFFIQSHNEMRTFKGRV
jgi:hypothetical protein